MSKSYYIYLNHYPKGYLYVGSHSWNGPKGQLDSTYEGSSSVAKQYGWVPTHIEIIKVSTKDSVFTDESLLIQEYASKYGIADCALRVRSNDFTSKYKAHGCLLNLHANTCENAIRAAHTAETLQKVAKTRHLNGADKRFSTAGTKVASTSEVRAKAMNTMKLNGTMDLNSWMSSEARQKRADTLRSNYKKDPFYRVPKFVDVYRDEVLLMSGSFSNCFLKLNLGSRAALSNWFRQLPREKGSYVLIGPFKFVISLHWSKSAQDRLYSQVSHDTIRTHVYYFYKDSELVVSGSALHCCNFLGFPNWNVSVSRKAKLYSKFNCHEYVVSVDKPL